MSSESNTCYSPVPMPDIELTNLPADLHAANISSSSSANANNTNKALEDGAIPLYHDLEKSSSGPDYHPAPKFIQRKLIVYLLVESLVTLVLYWNYTAISANVSPLVAPTLLGACTASLAQSINQYLRKKFSLNRILKFLVWGSINGCFTALWIDILIYRIDNLIYRIMVDQIIGAPAFQMIFSILSSLWDSGEISATIRQSYVKALKYSYCYWPFFSVFSFVFIPQSMMFPANCLANLVWNVILSKIN